MGFETCGPNEVMVVSGKYSYNVKFAYRVGFAYPITKLGLR